MAWNEAEVVAALARSEAALLWNQSALDGLKIPSLPHSKRTQLAGGCLHVAIEHSQAIVVLVMERLYGSALALQRPLLEARARGAWLMSAATDQDLDRAGRDEFPSFGENTEGMDAQSKSAALSSLKAKHWKRLCSLTHTGYQQIGARLTTDGLGYDYTDAEVIAALVGADMMALMAGGALAALGGDECLLGRFADRLEQLEVPSQVG